MGAVICGRWAFLTHVANTETEHFKLSTLKEGPPEAQTLRKEVPIAYFGKDWEEDIYLQEK